MDQPLGLTIGNANETAEALSILLGEGPPDVTELTRLLGEAMLVLCGVARERHEAEARLERALGSGSATQRAEAMIQAQGGDPRVASDPSLLARAPVETKVAADRGGFVAGIDARALGALLVAMGGGRALKEDRIDHGVGIRLLRRVGDKVSAGETLAVIEARRDAPEWAETAKRSYRIAEEKPAPEQLVLEELGSAKGA
jgi:thymidine phosphorylase